MDVRCQCGAVAFKTSTPAPAALYVCHCLECRRQSASVYSVSAMFPRFELPADVEPLVSTYTRVTDRGKVKKCKFCKACGSRLIHNTEGGQTTTVKAGCVEGFGQGELDVAKGIHIWTKRAVVPIPEGAEQWPEDPAVSQHSIKPK